MNSLPPVFISGIAAAECAYERFDASPPSDERERVLYTALRTDGFDWVRKSQWKGIAELARDAVAACLKRLGLPSHKINAVLFCTESFENEGPTGSHSRFRNKILHTLQLECDLVNAHPYFVWGAACANLTSVLDIASALIRSGRHERVLVVMSDRVQGGRPQVMASGAGVLSDSGVCCLISSDGEFGIEQTVSTFVPAAAPGAPVNMLLRGREFARTAADLADRFELKTGAPLHAAGVVIADNFRATYYDMVAGALHLSVAALHTPTKSQVGHTFSADCLLSLDRWSTQSSLDARRVVLLNIGPAIMGATLLRLDR